MESVLLLGGGGHCLSCIETIESSGDWGVGGIVDAFLPVGSRVLGYEVVGKDEELGRLLGRFRYGLVTVGQIGDPGLRMRLWEMLIATGYSSATVVASSARVSRHAEIGQGTVVMHRTFVNAAARVGANCIVNTGAIVEHGAVVGDHVHVSTGAIVNGDCEIGPGAFIGSGAVLRNGVRIGPRAVIGAGSVVVKDVSGPGTYIGNPARSIRG